MPFTSKHTAGCPQLASLLPSRVSCYLHQCIWYKGCDQLLAMLGAGCSEGTERIWFWVLCRSKGCLWTLGIMKDVGSFQALACGM